MIKGTPELARAVDRLAPEIAAHAAPLYPGISLAYLCSEVVWMLRHYGCGEGYGPSWFDPSVPYIRGRGRVRPVTLMSDWPTRFDAALAGYASSAPAEMTTDIAAIQAQIGRFWEAEYRGMKEANEYYANAAAE